MFGKRGFPFLQLPENTAALYLIIIKTFGFPEVILDITALLTKLIVDINILKS